MTTRGWLSIYIGKPRGGDGFTWGASILNTFRLLWLRMQPPGRLAWTTRLFSCVTMVGWMGICIFTMSALGNQTSEHTVKVWSRKWLFAVCGALAIVLFVDACMFLNGPPEPVYKGIGLSKWLDDSYTHNLSSRVSDPVLIRDQVFQSLGPEALPWLSRAIAYQDFRRRLNRSCEQFCRKHPLAGRWLSRHLDFNWAGTELHSFDLLATVAPGTPYESKALRALVAVPVDETYLKRQRLVVLGAFTNSPNVVIPILISELTNSTMVDMAIDVLQRQFGSVATPKLYPVALRETGIIRPAEVALEHADPLAYRKLQIEKEKLGVR